MHIKHLETKKVDLAADLAPYLDAWRELAADAPMGSPEWLLTWWEIYAKPEDELCVLLFHDPKGSLVGLAPLYLQKVQNKATFKLLGAGNACTQHTTWLSKSGWENPVGVEVARFLIQCNSAWNSLLFESVDADATAIYATVNYLVEKGFLYHQRQINSCWKIALPATWDDYLQMLSRSLRKRCRKLQRQFFDSKIVQVRQVKRNEELQEGFEILLKLHAARWGNDKKPLGIFDDQRFRRFHEKISSDLLARRKLRLAWLEYGGKPIAVEYQFFDSKAVYAYQAGVDLSMDEYSPGKLSLISAIQFAIAQGCEFFDLLRGDDPYKANWRATPVSCHDLRIWQDQVAGRTAWCLWNGYSLIAQRLKPIIPHRLINLGLEFFHTLQKAWNSNFRGNR